MLTIDAKQMRASPKKIGTTDEGLDVFEVISKGGLCLIVTKGHNKPLAVIGTGPHRAIARHIAKKQCKLTIDELAKSQGIGEADLQAKLPEYEALTARFRGIK